MVGRLEHNSGSSGCALLPVPNTNGHGFLPCNEKIHFKYPDFVTSCPRDSVNYFVFHYTEQCCSVWKVILFLKSWQKPQLLKEENNGFYQPEPSQLQVNHFTANSPAWASADPFPSVCPAVICVIQEVTAWFPSPSSAEKYGPGEDFYQSMEEIPLVLLTRFPFSSAVETGKAKQQRLNIPSSLPHHSCPSSPFSLP